MQNAAFECAKLHRAAPLKVLSVLVYPAMKILMALLAALTLCSTFAEAQGIVTFSPEDQIRAAAQRVLSEAMAAYDADLNAWVREAYQQIVADAAGVKPELQAGYIRDREAQLRDLAARRRAANQQQVWAAISKVVERTIEEGREILAAKREALAAQDQPYQVRGHQTEVYPNAYGLGINADQFARPHVYRYRDGEAVSPIFQGDVKRDAYGLGVHADPFGRPVYDSTP